MNLAFWKKQIKEPEPISDEQIKEIEALNNETSKGNESLLMNTSIIVGFIDTLATGGLSYLNDRDIVTPEENLEALTDAFNNYLAEKSIQTSPAMELIFMLIVTYSMPLFTGVKTQLSKRKAKKEVQNKNAESTVKQTNLFEQQPEVVAEQSKTIDVPVGVKKEVATERVVPIKTYKEKKEVLLTEKEIKDFESDKANDFLNTIL